MILYNGKKEPVRVYDIIHADGTRLAIINGIDEESKIIDITFIDTGFRCYIKIKAAEFVNHNNRAAARSYYDMIEKLKASKK